MSSLDQIAADELLGRLSHQQAVQARAAATQHVAPPTGAVNGLQQAGRSTTKSAELGRALRATTCPWCLEPECDGSASRCEEYENRIDLEHQAIRAPEIRIRGQR